MATALGTQILNRYYEGTATLAHLDQAKLRNWITTDEYDRAIAGLPPIGYVPSPTKVSAMEAPAAE